jgi:hypothetical protein
MDETLQRLRSEAAIVSSAGTALQRDPLWPLWPAWRNDGSAGSVLTQINANPAHAARTFGVPRKLPPNNTATGPHPVRSGEHGDGIH